MSEPSHPGPPLLEVRGLSVRYPVPGGFGRRAGWVRAVDDVSFTVARGTTVGLVGESGSGKTTVGRALLRLVAPPGEVSGTAFFDGQEILGLPERRFRPLRRRVQLVFQDPFNSLDPRERVEDIVAEPLEIHRPELGRADRRARVVELLGQVGLRPDVLRRYPHQFSGGQRQRIGIARALAVQPDFLVCDEPVSALDVSVQAQIVNLLQDLQERFGLTYLFIGHDLAVVEHLSDHLLVMHRGRLVESGPAEAIYRDPQQDYTKQLLAAARLSW